MQPYNRAGIYARYLKNVETDLNQLEIVSGVSS